ncbi:hypothetical protein ACQ4LE_001537 [Meloidogyne hapla]
MNSSINSISYLAFGGSNSTIIYPLFIPALLLSILSIIGIPLNASFCYITIKYRSQYSTLRSKTSTLLLTNCFSEITSQAGNFFFLYISSTGINFLRLDKAFYSLILTNFSLSYAYTSLMSISFDRFLAVAFPLYYNNTKHNNYIAVHIIVLLIFIIFSYGTMLIAMEINSPLGYVSGSNCEIIATISNINMEQCIAQYLFLFVTIGSYIFIPILVKFKAALTNEKMKKFNRSIFLIVLFNVGSYIIATMVITITYRFTEITPVILWYITESTMIYINIGAVGIVPIICLNSSDYRKAYQSEFKKFFKFIKKSSNQFNTPIVVLHSTNFTRQMYV